MKAFLGTVLTAIAAGVLLIAYGLLAPRAGAVPLSTLDNPGAAPVVYDARTGAYTLAQPMYASAPLALAPAATAVAPRPVPVNYVVPVASTVRRTSTIERARAPQRDWQKTALVIGGSTASGAGLGALVGGKKGALSGAAIGGGASTLWEALHK
jgi:hypothetical protein